MSFYEKVIKPIAFKLDPELVHDWAMTSLRNGLIRVRPCIDAQLETDLFGVKFLNPLGLAAGFDKNAVGVEHWHQLGFGFVEVGTVTALPQPGNPKPRMFRIPSEQGLINRLGFNNDGCDAVRERLLQHKSKIPIGVNIGKSKVTTPEEAYLDYSKSFKQLSEFGDYVAVNVSSPNTPGLRNLQAPEELRKILNALLSAQTNIGEGIRKPILVKIAPDLNDNDVDEIVDLAAELGISGIIATNTTISRETLTFDPKQTGGLSGKPLKTLSNKVLKNVCQRIEKNKYNLKVIGVGGIMNGDDLYEKMEIGADLCQTYTGWIYGGPDFVPRTLERYMTLKSR